MRTADPDAPGTGDGQARRSLTSAGLRAVQSRFPELDGEAGILGISLSRTAHAHATLSEQVVHRHQSRSWLVFRVLYVVWVFEPVSARDVVEAMQLSRQTVSNTLRALEADGLVTRTREGEDARLITIRLTPQGRASVEEALQQQFALDSTVFDVLTPDERRELARLLDLVRGRVRELDRSGSSPAPA